MGWRYRKSINVGLGFRINISKSGIGYSWGGPGYRKTWKADGGTRTTYSIPGTGLSYVEETPSQRMQNGKLPRANSMERYNLENSQTYSVVNGKIDALSTPENQLFTERIREINNKNFFSWLIGLCLVAINGIGFCFLPKQIWTPIFISFLILMISLLIILDRRRFITLEYVFDEEIHEIIKQRYQALTLLFGSSYVWTISSYKKVEYTRVNAGASTSIERSKPYISLGSPPRYLKIVNTDFKVYRVLTGKEEYIFLPDKILVVSGFEVGTLKYNDIKIILEDFNFVETEATPSDAKFLYNTWQNVNNDGSPDRRFSYNRQIPVYQYKKVLLKSETGLNLHLMVSSLDKAERFKENWDNIKDIL